MTSSFFFYRTGLRSRACQGFTLLEVMVVLVLIGIIFSFAMLSVSRSDLDEAMKRETRRLATLIGLANDEAVIRGQEFAIHFSETGYDFLVLQLEGWRKPQDDRLLKSYQLPKGMHVHIEVEGDPPGLDKQAKKTEETRTPQVYLLSSGEMTPFSAIFEAEGARVRYHLTASMLGNLDWQSEKVF
jgi:general secretion pathway protein H